MSPATWVSVCHASPGRRQNYVLLTNADRKEKDCVLVQVTHERAAMEH